MAARTRLIGIDAARALALFGMVATHVYPDLANDGAVTAAHQLASGRASAAFAVLAGVGLALASGGSRLPDPQRVTELRLRTFVRAVVLAGLGLWLGGTETPVAVILTYYALLFVLALPMIAWPPRRTALAAAGVAIAMPFVSFALRESIWADLPQGGPNLSFESVAAEPAIALRTLLITGYYPVTSWVAYIAAGLCIGRLALDSPKVERGLAIGGALLALGAVALSSLLLGPLGGFDAIVEAEMLAPEQVAATINNSLYGTTPTTTWWWLAVRTPHSTTPLDLAHTIGTSMLLIAVCLWAARRAPRPMSVLADVGCMTMTLYTAHVWILSTEILPDDDSTSYIIQIAAMIGFAWAWRARFQRGPLEQATKALSDKVIGLVPITASSRPSSPP